MEIRQHPFFGTINEICEARAFDENRRHGANATAASIRENIAGISEEQWKRWRSGRHVVSGRKFQGVKKALGVDQRQSTRLNDLFMDYRLMVGGETRYRRAECHRERLSDEDLSIIHSAAIEMGMGLQDLEDPKALGVFAHGFLDPRHGVDMSAVSMHRASRILSKLMKSRQLKFRSSDHRAKLLVICHWYALLSADQTDDEELLGAVLARLESRNLRSGDRPLYGYCLNAFPANFDLNLDAAFLPHAQGYTAPRIDLLEAAMTAAAQFDEANDPTFRAAGIYSMVSSAEYNLWRCRAFSGAEHARSSREAIRAIDRQDEADNLPAHMRLHNWLGITDTLMVEHRFQEAATYLKGQIEALESAKDSPRFQLGRAHLKMAICQWRIARTPRRLDEALGLAKSAAQIAKTYENATLFGNASVLTSHIAERLASE